MYPIGTHPFVEYSVASVVMSESFDQKCDEIAFVTGHHAEQVRSYFGDSYFGADIRYIEQAEQRGTGHAVDCARRALGFDDAIVWLADLYVPSSLFDRIRRHCLQSVLTVATDEDEENDDVRIDFDDRCILRSWRGSSAYFDIGLWKLGSEILSRICDSKTTEYRVLLNVQSAIEAGAEIGYQIADEWVHLGGLHPTVSENVRRVIDRMNREEPIFDYI